MKVLVVPVVAVALLASASASASLPVRLVFDRPEATPHTLVTAHSAGKGALLRVRKRTLRAYLQADSLVPLGRVSVNRKGNGTLRFTVPNVPPADYRIVLKGMPGQPALRPVGSFRVLDGPALRTCEQSVYGNLGNDWLSRANTVGPVHMIGFYNADAPDLDRSTGEYSAKVLLVIDRGPPVTLSVAPEDRARVALSYIPTRFNLNRVVDGDAAVTFEPCPEDATTQFNGSFVFRQPLCAHLQLRVEGQDTTPFALPLGRPCASRARAAAAPHPRIFLSPATLKTLRKRAKAGSTSWKKLQAQCNMYLKGKVEWPDGNDYPDPGIGEGYQGSEYFAAVANLGLCYQVTLPTNKKKAKAYGARGADVLTKMSTPVGQHEVDPLRDSGYGIRFYGLGMALGFDWLYPVLSTTLKARIDSSLAAWIGAYEQDGFEHEFPQGNYFAGYYAAKGIAGLALEGDGAHGAGWWSDWLKRVHGETVRPYYQANLSGGGWPEGWNYGPLGTLNMSWPALAAKTAKALDLTAAYSFPLTSPRYALYFTWPNLKTMEDSGLVYDGDDPTAARPSFFGDEAGLLEAFRDPFAPVFHAFAQDVRTARPTEEGEGDAHLWEDFLFWNPNAPASSYKTQPLSYLAKGMEMGAVRSSWNTDAVWGAFIGGPHTNFPDAGEELPDKGSLAIVRGGRQLLVNSWAALLRNTPGTTDGSQYFNPVYDNVFASPPDGNRDIFNVFYTQPEPLGQGYALRSTGARTTMDRFEDGNTYVAMRAVHLEDNYPQYPDGEDTSISSWTREVVYVRPSVFVVYDRTEVVDPAVDQWMAFHVSGEPHASGAVFDIGAGASYAGRVQTLLPAGGGVRTVDVFGGHKVYRLEIRPSATATNNSWLTVFDAANAPGAAATSSLLQAGGMEGALVHMSAANAVVLAGDPSSSVEYTVPARLTRHVLTDLSPGRAYSVTGSPEAEGVAIHVASGPGFTASSTGVLSFQSSAGGAVTP